MVKKRFGEYDRRYEDGIEKEPIIIRPGEHILCMLSAPSKSSREVTHEVEPNPSQEEKTTITPANQQYSFLEGDFGKQILQEYNRIVKQQYNHNPELKVLSYNEDKQVVTGSNTFACILINQILEKQGIRTATPSDIEQTLLQGDILRIKGNYSVDLGLVLTDGSGPNSYLSEHLASQIEKQDHNLNLPLVIPFHSIELINDNESHFKLSYKLKQSPEIIQAPVLIEANNWKKFLTTDNYGIPLLDKTGTRTLFTGNSDLCRLDLARDLDLYSCRYTLSYSYEFGRVVLVRGEATPPKKVTPTQSAHTKADALGKYASNIETYTIADVQKFAQVVDKPKEVVNPKLLEEILEKKLEPEVKTTFLKNLKLSIIASTFLGASIFTFHYYDKINIIYNNLYRDGSFVNTFEPLIKEAIIKSYALDHNIEETDAERVLDRHFSEGNYKIFKYLIENIHKRKENNKRK